MTWATEVKADLAEVLADTDLPGVSVLYTTDGGKGRTVRIRGMLQRVKLDEQAAEMDRLDVAQGILTVSREDLAVVERGDQAVILLDDGRMEETWIVDAIAQEGTVARSLEVRRVTGRRMVGAGNERQIQ